VRSFTGDSSTRERVPFPLLKLRPQHQQLAARRDRLRLQPAGRRPSPPRQRWTGTPGQQQFQVKRAPIKRARRPRSTSQAHVRHRVLSFRCRRRHYPAPPRRLLPPTAPILKIAAPPHWTLRPRFPLHPRQHPAKPTNRSEVHDRSRPNHRTSRLSPAIPRHCPTRKRPSLAQSNRFRPGPIRTG
jgi:hypothetical protein